MKTIRLIPTLTFGLMLAAATVASAQVKIGTNPTTIDPNSNLEVEASTAGRKVKIDKTTGQITIADGTQGEGKILTSDANGVARWQPAPGTSVIIGDNNSPWVAFVTPPTSELIPDCPITLNKGTYQLFYYAQFDYFVPGSTTTFREIDPTNKQTLYATFPRFIYFSFVTSSGAATFPSYGASMDGPHVIPVISSFQVAAQVSQLVVVTQDNTVIRPRYWGIPEYGRIANIGPISAVKL
ncbi:hypothetical protein [Dyadobacter sp. 676]|uniref:Uncharacterized protein n=1 Tax=Dyadobacter sp. 676 TaxID=3088362 RepID=A0AAU8FI64_9BACT